MCYVALQKWKPHNKKSFERTTTHTHSDISFLISPLNFEHTNNKYKNNRNTTFTKTTIMASTSTTTNTTTQPPLPTKALVQLPPVGMARVKSVLSADTVILLGKPPHANAAPPEVMFTLDSIVAPRYVNHDLNSFVGTKS